MTQRFAKDVTFDGVRSLEENIPFGFFAGAFAAAIGAASWMGVAVATGLNVEYAAPLAMGVLVGLAVQLVGHGSSTLFGTFGAIFTVIGCLGGRILTEVQLLTTPHHDFYNTLINSDFTQLIERVFERTDSIAYVVCAIGVIVGYRLAIRR